MKDGNPLAEDLETQVIVGMLYAELREERVAED